MTTKKTGPSKKRVTSKTVAPSRAKKGAGKQAAKEPAPTDIDPSAADVGTAANAVHAGTGATASKGKEGGGKRGRKPARSKAGDVKTSQTPLRDPRLPEPGTVLRKVDRHGSLRCECVVEEGGVRYNGTTYRSLSAAAVAAAKDLDIKGAQNGYVFWGLVKPARQVGAPPLARLEKNWERYATCARSVVAAAPTEEKPDLLAAIQRHRETTLVVSGPANS